MPTSPAIAAADWRSRVASSGFFNHRLPTVVELGVSRREWLATQRGDEPPPSMGRILRGAILGDWSRATRVERAMGEGVLAQGGYAVPSELSALWLDNARSASVCLQAGS